MWNFCAAFISATSGSERPGRMTEIPAAMWHILCSDHISSSVELRPKGVMSCYSLSF